MNTAEKNNPSGTLPPNFPCHPCINRPGIIHIRVFCLLWEGIILQPREKLFVKSESEIWKLWRMKMKIDKARNNQTISHIENLKTFPTLRQCLKHLQYLALFHNHSTILINFKPIRLFGEKDVSLISYRHFTTLLNLRLVTRTL